MNDQPKLSRQRIDPAQSWVRSSIPRPIPPNSIPARKRTHPEGKQGHHPGHHTSGVSAKTLDGLYIISVAARLLEMHPQTLRKYERVGLVIPSRTVGMLRLYSQRDIARLRLIKHLVEDLGINLAGVEFLLSLFNRLSEARERIAEMEEAERLREIVEGEIERLMQMLDTAFEEIDQG